MLMSDEYIKWMKMFKRYYPTFETHCFNEHLDASFIFERKNKNPSAKSKQLLHKPLQSVVFISKGYEYWYLFIMRSSYWYGNESKRTWESTFSQCEETVESPQENN